MKSYVLASAIVAMVIAAFQFTGFSRGVSAALAATTKEAVLSLPRLYSLGLKIQDWLPAQLKRHTSSILDDLAANGVTKRCIEPWSSLVGGDGNRIRYEREMNVFGLYFA